MKTCTKCGSEKEETDFNFKGGGKRHSWCKPCFNELTKAHYEANKERYNKLRYTNGCKQKLKMREFVAELKATNPCTDCGGFFHPVVMEYDHTGDDKLASVSKLVGTYYSKDAILEEIAKCELVCANCHRMRTLIRSQGIL